MNLRAIGDTEPVVNKTHVKGVIQGATVLDPVDAILLMREHMKSDPDRYDKLYRVLPVLAWVNTKLVDIVDEVVAQKSKMGSQETFRVTVEKRKTKLRSREVITEVAAVIDNPVDLVNPDWVVLIEIMGEHTGISIVRNNALFNIQKERARIIFSS
jgi:tRNA acetyltransferase TAN1